MAEYNLSGRIKVEGIGDYISDLGRAEKATRDLMKAAKDSGKLEIDVRGVLADLDKVERAVKGIADITEKSHRLDLATGDAVDDLQKAERAAKELSGTVGKQMKLNVDTGGAVGYLQKAEEAARELDARLGNKMTLTVGGVDEVATDLRNAEQAARELGQQIDRIGDAGGGMGTLAGKVGEVDSKAQAAHKSLGGMIGSLTDMAVRGAMYELVDLAGEALVGLAKGFLDFDQNMTEALAITRGVNSEMRSDLEDTAVTLSNRLGVAASEVALIYYDLFSAGMTASQAIQAVDVVAQFATASMISFGKAGDYLTTAQNALGLSFDDPTKNMEQMTRIANDFVAINNASVGTVEDFAKALTNKAGTAVKTYGLDVEETIATLGAFAERGVLGLKAGEQFSMMIRDLGKSYSKFSDEWDKLGISVFDSAGEFRSVADILTDINAVIGPMSDQMAQATLLQMGLTLRSQQTILTLMDAGPAIEQMTLHLKLAGDELGHVADNQLEAYRKKLESVSETAKNFAYDQMEKGLGAISAAAAYLGETFGPAADKVVEFLGNVLSGAAPVLEAFKNFAGLTVHVVLQGIATALEAVFGFLNNNQGVVEAFGAALALWAGVQVVGGIATLAGSLSGVLAPAINAARIKAVEMLAAFTLNQGALGSMGAIKAGIGDLITGIGAGTAAAGGLVLLAATIGGIISNYNNGKDAAKNFADEVNKKLNADSSVTGAKEALIELQAEYQRAQQVWQDNNSIWQGTLSGLPVVSSFAEKVGLIGENFYVAKGRADEMGERVKAAAESINQMESNVGFLANAFATNGASITHWIQDVGGADLTALEAGIVAAAQAVDLLGENAGKGAGPMTETQRAMFQIAEGGKLLPQVTTELEKLAEELDLDLTGPFEEWAPTLARSYVDLQLFNGQVLELATGIDDIGSTQINSTAWMEAFGALNDEATTLTEKFDALKSMMDETFGADLNVWDASTKMQSSLADMGTAVDEMLKKGGGFNTFSQEAFAARDALSGSVQAAIDYADALGRSSGDMAAGAAVLGEQREAIIGILTNLGMARDVAEDYVNQLGLTPERVAAMANAGDMGKAALDEATGSAQNLNKELGAAGSTPVVVPVDIDKAMAESDLAGLTTAPYAATITAGADTTYAWEGIRSVTAAEHRATVVTGADTAPASTAIGSVTAAEHRTTITANGNTTPAASAITTLTSINHQTVITANGNTTPATTAIGSVTAAEHRAMIVADANTAPARTAIGSVQTEPWAVTYATSANVATARGQLGAVQTEPWTAYIAARANTAQAEVDLSFLSRDRTVNFYANAAPSAAGGVTQPWAGADGGVIEAFAGGGFHEDHSAQIARPGSRGSYRMWAEDETGGEGYIPLANDSRRGRAMSVWGEIGKRFGMFGGDQWQPPSNSDQRTIITIPPGAVTVGVNAGVNIDRAELAGVVAGAVNPAVQALAADLAARLRRR